MFSQRNLLSNRNPIAVGNLLSCQLFFLVVGFRSYFPKHSISDIQKYSEFRSYNSQISDVLTSRLTYQEMASFQ